MLDQEEMPQEPEESTADPEAQQQLDVKLHPAVQEVKRIQAEWKRTGFKDPRIDAYLYAFNNAMQVGLDENMATIFAAKAVTGY